MPKQDTPVKPLAKTSSRHAPKPVTNEDLMDALSSVKADLKSDLAYVRAQMAELRAENSSLRSEIDILKGKLASLDTATYTQQSPSVVSQVLQETFERDRCLFNLIFYGVPESNSSEVPQRIAHDRLTCCNILESLGDTIPTSSKLIRLGKIREDKSIRPLKIIFENKNTADSLLLRFNSAKRSGSVFHDGFRMVRDKTVLQRKLLRACHAELDTRVNSGEKDLRIIFNNGIPEVKTTVPKNRVARQRPPDNQP